MTDTMPCPRGCATTTVTADSPCTECGHQLTIAEQRHLATKAHGRAAIARVRADWDRWKDEHPRTSTSTRRTA